MVPFPDPPQWLRRCEKCAPLYETYRSHVAAADPMDTLRAAEELSGHLVADHLAQLPAYAPGCPTCAEWRAGAPRTAEVIGRPLAARALAEGDLRHRAGHLFAPTIGDT